MHKISGYILSFTLLVMSIEGFTEEDHGDDLYSGGIYLDAAETNRIILLLVLICGYNLARAQEITTSENIMHLVYFLSALYWASNELIDSIFHGLGIMLALKWFWTFYRDAVTEPVIDSPLRRQRSVLDRTPFSRESIREDENASLVPPNLINPWTRRRQTSAAASSAEEVEL